LNYKILGIWAGIGAKNADFEIKKNEIYYPDQSSSYSYNLLGDSISIKYDDYEAKFRIKMRGNDTLIFQGDDTQIYCRFK
jgi:hypothetical protein